MSGDVLNINERRITMKGLTHIFFGLGVISSVLVYIDVSILLWGVGTLILTPMFSRLPDYDQKIAKITFNQVIPHRGKLSHNLFYGLPVILCFSLGNFPLLQMVIISSFGAIFVHVVLDACNSGGVWIGFWHFSLFKIRWDSFWANSLFKLVGIGLLGIATIANL